MSHQWCGDMAKQVAYAAVPIVIVVWLWQMRRRPYMVGGVSKLKLISYGITAAILCLDSIWHFAYVSGAYHHRYLVAQTWRTLFKEPSGVASLRVYSACNSATLQPLLSIYRRICKAGNSRQMRQLAKLFFARPNQIPSVNYQCGVQCAATTSATFHCHNHF